MYRTGISKRFLRILALCFTYWMSWFTAAIRIPFATVSVSLLTPLWFHRLDLRLCILLHFYILIKLLNARPVPNSQPEGELMRPCWGCVLGYLGGTHIGNLALPHSPTTLLWTIIIVNVLRAMRLGVLRNPMRCFAQCNFWIYHFLSLLLLWFCPF